VTVTAPSGTLTSNTQFRVIPKITGFGPTSGASGTVVTITGTSLTQTTNVTKSYALVGIRALNPSRYKALLRSFRDSKEEVVTQRGCIKLHESLAEVLKHIGAGE